MAATIGRAVTTPLRKAGPRLYVIAATAAIAALVYLATWGSRYGLDLRVYRDSLSFLTSGGNPYTARFTRHRLPFTYPPFAFLALSPLIWAPLRSTQWLLWTASIAATAISAVLVLRERGMDLARRAWLLAFAWSCASILLLEPVRSGIDYGQIDALLMLLVVVDLLLVPSPFQGIAIGVAAAVKLTPLIFVLVFFADRNWKSITRIAGSFLACEGLAWILWPRLSAIYWLHDLINPARIGGVAYSGNQSWYAVVHRHPFPPAWAVASWVLLSLLTVAIGTLVAWSCRRKGQQASAMLSIALTGLLVSPISWTHHWVWVLLVPVLILNGRDCGVPRPVRMLLWALVAVTVAAPYWWIGHGMAADAFNAVLPLSASAVLAVWGWTALRSWQVRSQPPQGEPRSLLRRSVG